MAPNPRHLISDVLERGKQVASRTERLVRNVTGRGGEGGGQERPPVAPEPQAGVTPIRSEGREGVRATPKGAAATPADTATERARKGATKRKPATKRSTGAGAGGESSRTGRAAGPTRSATRTGPGAPRERNGPPA